MCLLQVGSTVEVKTNEGVSSEAVISKLTDASLYTVGESLGWSPHTPLLRSPMISQSPNHHSALPLFASFLLVKLKDDSS